MNIKFLFSATFISLGTLTSTGYAKLSAEREARINDIARTCATVCTASKAANLLVNTAQQDYIYLDFLSLISNHLYGILDATVEGSDSDNIMRIKRALDVLEGVKKQVLFLKKDQSCVAWAKTLDAQQAKAIGLGLANFAIKEVIYDQAGNLIGKSPAGDEIDKQLIRIAIKVAINTLVESLLDTAEAYAQNKLIKEDKNIKYMDIAKNTALKISITTAIEQITGFLVRRGLQDHKEEAKQLQEVVEIVKAIEPTISEPKSLEEGVVQAIESTTSEAKPLEEEIVKASEATTSEPNPLEEEVIQAVEPVACSENC